MKTHGFFLKIYRVLFIRVSSRAARSRAHPLLPLHRPVCGSLGSHCGFKKVLSDHFVFAQPPDALVDHSEDLVQPAVQGQQVGLCQDGP